MSPYPIADLVGYLAGEWWLTRTLADLRSGANGRFEGTLTCAPGHEGTTSLTMYEDGELDWSGARRPAFRTTRLTVAADPGAGEVRFDDGRLFHELDLRSGACVVRHPCAPDTYGGTFTAHGHDEWSYEWRVAGPRKDLRLTSRLLRRRPDSR